MTGSSIEGGNQNGSRLRGALLAVVLVGTLGLIAELILLDHFETFTQWLPLAILGGVLAAALLVALRPTRSSLRVFQLVMLAVFVTGVAGVVLHYRSNVIFEQEMNRSIAGRELIWRSLRGAVPALAPGALVQLALVGLVFAWGHPGLRTPVERPVLRE